MVNFCEEISGSPWLGGLVKISETTSDLQTIQYFRSKEFGRVLVIDGELQHVEAWAPFYHEIVIHLPMAFLRAPKRCLVLGGGSLFAAEELLKYQSIDLVEMVDHDLQVIDATLDAYPERRWVVEDERFNLVNMDCEEYLQKCDHRFDIIVNDCFNLLEVDARSSVDLYHTLEGLLAENGLVSDLVYRSIYSDDLTRSCIERIPDHLSLAMSLVAVPEYPGVFHALTIWGKNRYVTQNAISSLNGDHKKMFASESLTIFNPTMIPFHLYLPPYLRRYTR